MLATGGKSNFSNSWFFAFRPGGLLVGQLDHMMFYEKKSGDFRPHILPANGKNVSLTSGASAPLQCEGCVLLRSAMSVHDSSLCREPGVFVVGGDDSPHSRLIPTRREVRDHQASGEATQTCFDSAGITQQIHCSPSIVVHHKFAC